MAVFIAHRTDGFGARLYNMMITMMLAEAYGGEFRFTWRETSKEFHALAGSQHVFADAFLARHLIGEEELKRLGHSSVLIEPESELNEKTLSEIFSAGTKYIVVSRFDEPEDIRQCLPPNCETLIADVFEKIEFISSLKEIIQSARNLHLPSRPVAMHLRSGDIVFGHYRLDTGFESKVIPLPLAYSIIRTSIEEGRYPVIFGQDQETCTFLAEVTGCRTVEQIADLSNMTVLERALFEIVLLSRMEIIHAGMSLFAYVPAALGYVPIRDPLRIFKPQEIASMTIEGLPLFEKSERVSPLQIAFCYRIALHFADDFPANWKLAAVNGAIKNDPGNVLYMFMKAQILFLSGQYRDGDEILKSAFSLNGKSLKKNEAYGFLTRRFPDGSLKSEPWLRALDKQFLLDSPFACLSVSVAAMRVQCYGQSLKFVTRAIFFHWTHGALISQLAYLSLACLSFKWIRSFLYEGERAGTARQWLKKISE